MYELCKDSRAVTVGVFVQVAQNNVNEAIEEFKPDEPVPKVIEFPRPRWDLHTDEKQ
jgi:hypothetical protein